MRSPLTKVRRRLLPPVRSLRSASCARFAQVLALVRSSFSRHTFFMTPDSDSAFTRSSATAYKELMRRSEEHQLLLNRRTRKMQWVCLFSALALAAVFFAESDAQLFSIASVWLLIVCAIAASPGRWFIKDHPAARSSGPRPALRKQPPSAPARLRAWPAREGPLPPLPPPARLPHERTES